MPFFICIQKASHDVNRSRNEVMRLKALLLDSAILHASGEPIITTCFFALVIAVYNKLRLRRMRCSGMTGMTTKSNSLPCDLCMLMAYAGRRSTSSILEKNAL